MATKVKAKAKKKAVAKVKAKPAKKTIQKKVKVAKAAPKLTAHSFSAKMLTPLDDRIVVRIAMSEEKTAGGLYIPGTATTQPDRGEVMAKGPGRKSKKGSKRPLDVEVGDTILFPQYTGTKITIGAEDFLIMREEDVLGVVET